MQLIMEYKFQDPVTAIMEGLIDFHNDIQFYLILTLIFVAWCLFSITWHFGIKLYFGLYVFVFDKLMVPFGRFTSYFWNFTWLPNSGRASGMDFWLYLVETSMIGARRDSLILKKVVHATFLEIVWTIVPVFVLVAIAIPSFALLYSIDEVVEPTLTLQVTGSQWFWSYQYGEQLRSLSFDSFMLSEADLKLGEFRLLEVDNQVFLPIFTHIRILVTADDVLHSWAVPALGVKMDCVPGRLNQVSLFMKRDGVFYGQCSELCGVNHGFMPIVINAVYIGEFLSWADV